MHNRSFRTALAAAAVLMPILATPTFAAQPAPQAEMFPPWQHGKNNDATNRGFEFTVPQVDDLADFHGDITDPKLVLYVGGNYFFAMAPLVAEFEKQHPDYKGRIYWETIPPGLLVKQIEAGGTITSGNMTWTANPDAYLAGLKAGVCPDLDGFAKTWKLDRRFEPHMDPHMRERKWQGWQDAVQRTLTPH